MTVVVVVVGSNSSSLSEGARGERTMKGVIVMANKKY